MRIHLVRILSLLLLAALLAACGGGATDDAASANPTSGANPGASGQQASTPEAEPDPQPDPGTSPQAQADPEPDPGTGGEVNEEALVIYSGRSEELVGPIIEDFEKDSGIDVEVRYGDTAELASTILEEGENSPADVFFAQDAGALGALAEEGRLGELSEDVLDKVPEQFRSKEGRWVGVSGRARVVAYNTAELEESDLPESILDFTDPKWKGKIGWAPTNGSFQAFVTALRLTNGEDAAREWLEGIQANDPKVYEGNTPIVEAVANGEIQVGFVNHYYLFRLLEENGQDFGARNYYLKNGDPGALVNVAGAGILEGTDKEDEAKELVEFLVSEEAQQYFANETFEYPLVEGVEINEQLVPLDEIETPDVDLSDLTDLQGTLELLQETGVL